jgi:hypothetical protein
MNIKNIISKHNDNWQSEGRMSGNVQTDGPGSGG